MNITLLCALPETAQKAIAFHFWTDLDSDRTLTYTPAASQITLLCFRAIYDDEYTPSTFIRCLSDQLCEIVVQTLSLGRSLVDRFDTSCLNDYLRALLSNRVLWRSPALSEIANIVTSVFDGDDQQFIKRIILLRERRILAAVCSPRTPAMIFTLPGPCTVATISCGENSLVWSLGGWSSFCLDQRHADLKALLGHLSITTSQNCQLLCLICCSSPKLVQYAHVTLENNKANVTTVISRDDACLEKPYFSLDPLLFFRNLLRKQMLPSLRYMESIFLPLFSAMAIDPSYEILSDRQCFWSEELFLWACQFLQTAGHLPHLALFGYHRLGTYQEGWLKGWYISEYDPFHLYPDTFARFLYKDPRSHTRYLDVFARSHPQSLVEFIEENTWCLELALCNQESCDIIVYSRILSQAFEVVLQNPSVSQYCHFWRSLFVSLSPRRWTPRIIECNQDLLTLSSSIATFENHPRRVRATLEYYFSQIFTRATPESITFFCKCVLSGWIHLANPSPEKGLDKLAFPCVLFSDLFEYVSLCASCENCITSLLAMFECCLSEWHLAEILYLGITHWCCGEPSIQISVYVLLCSTLFRTLSQRRSPFLCPKRLFSTLHALYLKGPEHWDHHKCIYYKFNFF